MPFVPRIDIRTNRVAHRALGVPCRSGMVLLEVIVALTIFVIAGLSAAVWVQQTLLTVDHAQDAITDMSAASRYLDRMALWPRDDLDRHLGARREGPWIVVIDRPTPTIYSVAIGDSGTSQALLETWLYRAVPVQPLGTAEESHAQ